MERCGSPLSKHPGRFCRRWPMKGYGRCRRHSFYWAGGLWRYGDEAAQRASVERLTAHRAIWAAEHVASDKPWPCVRKSGDAYWTTATVQAFYRAHPMSWGWRLSAAKAGKLPCVLAVLDPAEAERRLLWSLPDSDALGIVEEEMALRGGKGPPQAKRRSRQIPP